MNKKEVLLYIKVQAIKKESSEPLQSDCLQSVHPIVSNKNRLQCYKTIMSFTSISNMSDLKCKSNKLESITYQVKNKVQCENRYVKKIQKIGHMSGKHKHPRA